MKTSTSLIIMALGAVLLGGCNADGLNTQQQAHLDSAIDAYRANRTPTAIEQCNALLMQEPAGSAAGFRKAHYLRALAYIRQNNTAGARRDLEAVLATGPNAFSFAGKADDLTVKTRDALGELDFRAGHFTSAQEQFACVLRSIDPEAQPADHAAFRMGCIAQRLGNWTQGDTYFQQLKYFNANSPMAKDAKARSFARHWSVQLGLYANYSGATAEAARLTQAGWKTRCVPITRSDKQYYALRAGQWNTYTEAKRQLPRLKLLQKDAYIIPSR